MLLCMTDTHLHASEAHRNYANAHDSSNLSATGDSLAKSLDMYMHWTAEHLQAQRQGLRHTPQAQRQPIKTAQKPKLPTGTATCHTVSTAAKKTVRRSWRHQSINCVQAASPCELQQPAAITQQAVNSRRTWQGCCCCYWCCRTRASCLQGCLL
jgi:hypothetical protein